MGESEVAALEPEQQDYWLERAVTEELSHKELRRAVQKAKLPAVYPDPHRTYSVSDADGAKVILSIRADLADDVLISEVLSLLVALPHPNFTPEQQ